MTRAARRATIAIAVAASVALAGVVLAAGGLKTEKQTVPVDDNGVALATARCAGQGDAVSGGYSTKVAPRGAFIYSSRPAGGNRWKAATEIDEETGESLTAYVYCRNQKTSVETGQVTVSLEEGRAKAKCPKGKAALSGGFRAPLEQGLLPSDSRRAGKRGWKVNAAGFNAEDLVLRAYVVCGKKPLRREVESELFEPEGVPYDRLRLTAKCDPDERVVSGGFKAGEPLDKGGPFFDASYRTGPREWTVSVISAIDVTVAAYAYCEPK